MLERQTGKFASFAVAFAFVSIATGIFTTYGSTLITSGPLGIWTWPIVTAGQLAVALVLGALASRIPVTGYSYQWMSRLGSPLLGWIIGWISFMFLEVVVVAVDYTIASTVLPSLLHYDATRTLDWLVTAIVLVVQGILVATSTTWTERVNNVAVSAELLHPVDTADIAALDGRHVAAQVRNWLRTHHAPAPGITLTADPPLRWIAPQILRHGDPAPARHRLLAWSDAYVPAPHVQVIQDGRVLASRRLPWPAAPGRVFRIPSSLLTRAGARPEEGTIHITLANAPQP